MMKILLCSFLLTFAVQAQTPAVGDPAPNFTLPYATRDSVARTPLTLAHEIGRGNIILAFYPASFRDNFSALQSLGAEILAVSGDYPWSHHQWAKYQNLPFRLLSDHNHHVAAEYGSFDGSSPYNKRTVFLIDKNGKIVYRNLHYSVSDAKDFNLLKEAMSHLQ